MFWAFAQRNNARHFQDYLFLFKICIKTIHLEQLIECSNASIFIVITKLLT